MGTHEPHIETLARIQTIAQLTAETPPSRRSSAVALAEPPHTPFAYLSRTDIMPVYRNTQNFVLARRGGGQGTNAHACASLEGLCLGLTPTHTKHITYAYYIDTNPRPTWALLAETKAKHGGRL